MLQEIVQTLIVQQLENEIDENDEKGLDEPPAGRSTTALRAPSGWIRNIQTKGSAGLLNTHLDRQIYHQKISFPGVM